MNKHVFLLIIGLIFTVPVVAQQEQWHHADPENDRIMGISTDKAYELLSKLPKPQKPVVVAVIDGGLDINHEDLKSVLWVNAKEVAGNKKDDDKNGYADDVHGWNFLGNKDGRNLVGEQLEVTRLYKRLQPLFENADGSSKDTIKLNAAQKKQFALWKEVKVSYEKKILENEHNMKEDSSLQALDQLAGRIFKQIFGAERIDTTMLKNVPIPDTSLQSLAEGYYQMMTAQGCADMECLTASFQEYHQHLQDEKEKGLNLNYSERNIVGDNPDNTSERIYGNNDLGTPLNGTGAMHGTHVTGIIAADRNNSLGIKGVADHVKILFVRSTPDGDERDKDVANAIRYAVDNGAKIINMSFGKGFSPEKEVVDEAIRYADKKGVLLVHAAGNDNLDLDSAKQYPSPKYLNGAEIPNYLTVGASNRLADSSLAAVFSNYGKNTVDVFAPGVAIMSTVPENKYDQKQGTSMAAPVVAGIAAVLKSYFPDLTPVDIKRIIVQSAIPNHTQVMKPGSPQLVDFASLSKSGAIVNLYNAVKMAMETSGAKGMP